MQLFLLLFEIQYLGNMKS